jgi:hypothetical protein
MIGADPSEFQVGTPCNVTVSSARDSKCSIFRARWVSDTVPRDARALRGEKDFLATLTAEERDHHMALSLSM